MTEQAAVFDMVGQHLLLCYTGCDGQCLNDLQTLKTTLFDAVAAAGAQVLGHTEQMFEVPNRPELRGYTMLIQLSESHASFHSYPEVGGAFLDIFCCGSTCDVQQFHHRMHAHLKPTRYSSQVIQRVAPSDAAS